MFRLMASGGWVYQNVGPRILENREGVMKGLLKGALAAGGGVVGVEVLRRALFSGTRRRYEPWERSPYKDFPNRVLIVGGGFRLQGGPDPLRTRQGPRRRWDHAHLARELLHVLADAG